MSGQPIYTRIGWADRNAPLWLCGRCGGVVGDRNVHTRWHADLDEQARRAEAVEKAFEAYR